MAFNTKNEAPANNNGKAPALSFVNIAMPVGDGKTKKIGYLAFSSDDPDMVKVSERLAANPELLDKFMSNLSYDFRLNVKTEAKAADIDAMFA